MASHLRNLNAALATTLSGAVLGATGAAGLAALPATAQAQVAPSQTASGSSRSLKLAPDSPFRDPDTIYLEADELINDDAAQVLTAIGEVEGRYEDRTLRADRVDYSLTTGSVLATGNVVLIDATGDVTYADKLELSDQLQAGTAANFTARLASGATTAARFVQRREDGGIELYNAVYTACELCDASGDDKRPTWRLRARKVAQDEGTRTIRYRDAVVELFGLPVFYTPYLAHPDPSADRASGLLTPGISGSGSRGLTVTLPYYWAVDDYTEATVTPHLFTKVNPLLELQGRRRFATGEIVLDSSLTYSAIFDRNGDDLDDPARFRDPGDVADSAGAIGHLFVDGYFRPTDALSYGYTLMTQSDDSYLERYNLSQSFKTNGLLSNESRLNTSQAFAALQGDNYRISASVASYQRLNSRFISDPGTGLVRAVRDNDDILPVILPRVQADYVWDDPIIGGQLELTGDATFLTREEGTDYGRLSGGANYQKTIIAPMGLEIKPFAWARFDAYEIETDNRAGDPRKADFSRTIGQGGIDIRYPLIQRGGGDSATRWILEPRVQLTQSFGEPKLDQFIDPLTDDVFFEDGESPELGASLLFEPNKADGYDFFQTGRRLDVGTSVIARSTLLGRDSEVSLFGGRSFGSDLDGQFSAGSGLLGDDSEYVGELGLKFGSVFESDTRLRYNEDLDRLTRLSTRLSARSRYVDISGAYFRLNSASLDPNAPLGAPTEEVSGQISLKPTKNWKVSYSNVRDLERKVTRRQSARLTYSDECSLLELFVTKSDFNRDILRNDTQFGIRFALTTLGGVG